MITSHAIGSGRPLFIIKDFRVFLSAGAPRTKPLKEDRSILDMTDLAELLERLEKRAKEDEQCAINNQVVADCFAAQMEHFEARDGRHNTYAVRMAVDHQQGAKRDARYAADLRQAIAALSAQP